jgi:nucleoside-diphosphate-sugar epimerase
MKETVDLIQDIMGSNAEVREDIKRIRPKNSEVFRLFCDNSKISQKTNYSPKFSFRDGLQKTIEWFEKEENLKKYKIDIFNI